MPGLQLIEKLFYSENSYRDIKKQDIGIESCFFVIMFCFLKVSPLGVEEDFVWE